MSLRRWVVIGVVGTALAVLSGVVTARAMRTANDRVPEVKSNFPSVQISEAELRFGDVWEQQDFVWPITVVNMSDTVQEITGMAGSCSCQTISPRQYTLQPGESRRFEVRLDLRANGSQALAKPVDNFAVAIWATVKGEPKDIHCKLTGRVMHAVRCPDRLDLGRISELAPEKGAIEFGVHPLVELSRFRIVPGAAWVRTELKQLGADYAVKVILQSGLKQQDYATEIKFELANLDGRELPVLTIPVKFSVGPDIVAEPESVNFGDREVGEVVHENVSVYSVSGRKLMLTSAVCEADGLRFATLPLQGQICLELNQSATKSFDKSPLRVVVCDEAGGTQTVEIPLRINVRPKAAAEKQP